jgi:hypothetical protein
MLCRKRIRLGFSAAGAALAAAFLFTTPARADVDLGVGLVGAVGGNFLDKPDRTAGEPDIYPGYGGLTIGGGLMLDARFLDGLLGVEADVIRSSDKGSGDVTFTSQIPGFVASEKVTHKIGQGAWHVPLLAKLAIPSPVVAPVLMLGPEFVFPSSPSSTVDPALQGFTVRAKADNYVAITAGVGVEIKLPLPILDLRIPVDLRASYNPSVSSKFSDRVQSGGTTLTYHSEWKYSVALTAGAALYF